MDHPRPRGATSPAFPVQARLQPCSPTHTPTSVGSLECRPGLVCPHTLGRLHLRRAQPQLSLASSPCVFVLPLWRQLVGG